MTWQREAIWHRLDERGNERCVFVCDDDSCVVEGIGVLAFNGSGMVFEYHLEFDAAWQFTSGVIGAKVGDEEHARIVERRPDGTWYVDGDPSPQYDSFTDIDLSFSPSTNSAALRRLKLRKGDEAESRAVLVEEPTLSLGTLVQKYRRASDTIYAYSAEGLETTIEVDEDSIVVEYAGHFQAATAQQVR